jgi:hypothetical protein
MRKSQVIAVTAITATIAAGITLYFLSKRRQNKRKDFVANAGYEMAYDLNYPVRYRRHKRHNGHHRTL